MHRAARGRAGRPAGRSGQSCRKQARRGARRHFRHYRHPHRHGVHRAGRPHPCRLRPARGRRSRVPGLAGSNRVGRGLIGGGEGMTAVAGGFQVPAPAYGATARAVHWLIAGLAVIVVALGLAIPEAPRESLSREWLLTLHRSLGVLILVLMVSRALWRLAHPPPPLPPSLAPVERWAAHAHHLLLYV